MPCTCTAALSVSDCHVSEHCLPACMHTWLQDAEVQELVLEAKRSAKAAEQADLSSRLAEVRRALDAKKAEGDDTATRRSAVVAELEVLLADQDVYREQLTKAFNRWVCRKGMMGLLATSEVLFSANEL